MLCWCDYRSNQRTLTILEAAAPFIEVAKCQWVSPAVHLSQSPTHTSWFCQTVIAFNVNLSSSMIVIFTPFSRAKRWPHVPTRFFLTDLHVKTCVNQLEQWLIIECLRYFHQGFDVVFWCSKSKGRKEFYTIAVKTSRRVPIWKFCIHISDHFQR